MSASPNMPVYTTAPNQIPLLAEPTTLAPHQYMQQGNLFANPYPNPYVTDPYASSYPSSAASSLPSHYA